jgi:hypothetical protein
MVFLCLFFFSVNQALLVFCFFYLCLPCILFAHPSRRFVVCFIFLGLLRFLNLYPSILYPSILYPIHLLHHNQALLVFSVDPRPKVRRAAQSGACDVTQAAAAASFLAATSASAAAGMFGGHWRFWVFFVLGKFLGDWFWGTGF